MKPLTDKQKKYLWVAAAVLLGIHFAPRMVATIHRAMSGLPPAVVHKSPPARPAPVPLHSSADANALAAQEAQYLGVWAGQSLMQDQSTCRISLRLVKSTDDPAKVKGYESKQCMPTAALQGGRIARQSIAELIRTTSPVSSVLTGTPGKDAITFTVDKTIGMQPGNCDLTGFSVTSFGPGQLQAQWQDGKCDSGQMLLLKRG